MTSLEFRRRGDGTEVVVLTLAGELDLCTDASMRVSLRAACEHALSNETSMIIDCTRVTFLALSGVRALLDAHQRFPHDSRLCLVGPRGGQLARMVELLDLVDVFAIYPTVGEAVRVA
ncbi:STAS domain-containing protein [Actinomycetospora sp. C-140]